MIYSYMPILLTFYILKCQNLRNATINNNDNYEDARISFHLILIGLPESLQQVVLYMSLAVGYEKINIKASDEEYCGAMINSRSVWLAR